MSAGVLTLTVTPGGPAAKAGMLVGDVLLAIDQTAIESPEELMDLMMKIGAGHYCTPANLARRDSNRVERDDWRAAGAVNAHHPRRHAGRSCAASIAARTKHTSTSSAEFDSLAEARAAAIDADAVVVARAAGPLDESEQDTEWIEESLTPREIEVLELLAEGRSNKSIAERLGISDQTVKFHVASILAKLGAANRTEAVRLAVRRGLISL